MSRPGLRRSHPSAERNALLTSGRKNTSIEARAATAEHTYIQQKNCQSYLKHTKLIEQCQSCIERQAAAGGCRFIGIRAFKLIQDQTDNDQRASSPLFKKRKKVQELPKGEIVYDDYCIVGNRVQDETNTIPITNPGTSDDKTYIMHKILPSLERVYTREARHENTGSYPIARIQSETSQRAVCDACATSIFIVSYICVVCGKEYCPDCLDEWGDDRDARFDKCSRRRVHTKSQLVKLVRADDGEISKVLQEIYTPSRESQHFPEDVPRDYINDFLPYYSTSVDNMSEAQFRSIWSRTGIPVVLTNCLPRFSKQWSPEYFTKKYGSDPCTIHSCSSSKTSASTVSKFFSQFDDSIFEGKVQSVKLKDWPPTDDFALIFPSLFQDFEQALPWNGRYMTRTGALNLASRFPEDWNKPDLGPKMYNATPAPGEGPMRMCSEDEETEGLFGTTNLHLDITDAINIMLYAAGNPIDRPVQDSHVRSRPCAAIWDIFPPESATDIRIYLKSQNPQLDDPIHRQTYYLSDADLQNLANVHNVKPYRIFQNPGDAVLIPAGCPHQVRNTRSCIKIAVDFLSPESVVMCEGLLQESRALSKSGKGGLAIEGTGKGYGDGKREDVLQLWACLKFTWDSLRR